jgi:AAA+ superfamily predicted ATPase
MSQPPFFDSLRSALEKSPDQVSLLMLAAHARLDAGEAQEARQLWERVLALDPSQLDAQLGVARALFSQGDISAAAVRAERVLQQNPSLAAAHVLLSRVLLHEGERQRAFDHLQEALRLDGSVCDAVLDREFGAQLRESQPHGSGNEVLPELPMAESGNLAEESMDPAGMDGAMEWRPELCFAPGDPARHSVSFDDIGGLDDLKEEVRLKMVYPLQFPELYKAYGKRTGGAILIHGPPGCGKSLLLRAVAAEVPCNYLAVALHEVFDPYLGSSERNLHQIFQTARALAPCVLVFDHLDSLAQDRRLIREGPMRHLVNQFLHEMDALRIDNQRVLVLGATNQPWVLDPAFRRPGRFDEVLAVVPPDRCARQRIAMLMAREKPIDQFDAAALAAATEGFSGADLRHVFERSAELTLAAAIHGGQPAAISMDTMLRIAATHRPSAQDWRETGAMDGELNGPNPTPTRKAQDRASATKRDSLS